MGGALSPISQFTNGVSGETSPRLPGIGCAGAGGLGEERGAGLKEDREDFGAFRVFEDAVMVFQRQSRNIEDCVLGALRNAGPAVDALDRIDPQGAFVFVKAVDRTHRDTVGVLAVHA